MTDRATTIALSGRDVDLLKREKEARRRGLPQPVNIRLLLDEISAGGVVPLDRIGGPQGAIGFVYHFSRAIVTRAVLRRPYAFMVWGLPKRGLLRDAIARFVLRRASVLLANDKQSAVEATNWSGKPTRIIPYFIDTDFFRMPDTSVKREAFLFCPSSNGRDPELLCDLAERGHRVVWLNNEPALIKEYSQRHPGLTIVTRPDFAELRTLYQTCRACILPIRDKHHAAGQTTALEALACGAPVFMTEGRTSDIFKEERIVVTVPSNHIDLWQEALERTDGAHDRDHRRVVVCEKFSVAKNREILIEILTDVDTQSVQGRR